MTNEAMFLEAIRDEPEDRQLWQAYADWLEEQGDIRSRFLRIFEELRDLKEGDPGFVSLRAEKERLRPSIDRSWQRKLGLMKSSLFVAEVEKCELFQFRCNKTWNSLRETESERVRFCTECEMHVYYCATDNEGAEHAKLGHCIAMEDDSDTYTLGSTSGDF